MTVTPQDIIHFWFEEIDSQMWFRKDVAFDEQVRKRFSDIYLEVERCETFRWRKTPEGRLAEIIVLDQFSRNMFRDTALAFKNDPLALALAQEAVACGDAMKLSAEKRAFIYLPYMHSESSAIHEESVRLFSQEGLESNLEFEFLHKEMIDKFGRYPYRNELLGRESTKEELDFLKRPGSYF